MTAGSVRLGASETALKRALFALLRSGRRLVEEPVRMAVSALALLSLGALVGYPLFLLCRYSLYDPAAGFTLKNLAAIFQERGFLSATGNSLLLALYVPAGCLALGIPMAVLVARTNMPGKAVIRAVSGIAFIVPSFITVIAWIFLAAPNSGLLNKWAVAGFGLAGRPFNIFTFGGLVFVEVAHLYPLVFFAVTAALDNIDSSFEQVARSLGAGRFRALRTITLPIVGPAILSSTILTMLDTVSSFGAPITIGLTANFSVLTVKIFTLLTQPPRFELAAGASLPIVAFTLACLYLQRRYLQRNRFTTLTGKATARAIDIGRWRWPAFAACGLVLLVTVGLPMAGLTILSLLNTFGAAVAWKNLVIDNYLMFFDDSFPIQAAVKNSLILAVTAATLSVGLGVVFTWLVDRTTLPGRGIITGVIMITYGLPPVALGVGIILGYINLFYGTLAMLLVGYVAKQLPIAFVILRNTMRQISVDLDEVGRISGASWLRCLKDITVPLLKPGILLAWLLIFSLCLRELSLSALLVQPGTEVMAVSVLDLIEAGYLELAAAVSVVIALFSVAIVFLARLLAGRGVLEVA